jgi:hypothetical protein
MRGKENKECERGWNVAAVAAVVLIERTRRRRNETMQHSLDTCAREEECPAAAPFPCDGSKTM